MRLIFIILVLLTFSSCKQDEPLEINNESLNKSTKKISGVYYRVKNNDRAGLMGIMKLISEINFDGSHARFKYATIQMSGKFEIDGSYIYINTGGELGIISMEIMSNGTLEGEGFIHGTFSKNKPITKKINPDTEATREKIITKSDSEVEVNTGEGNTTNSPNSFETNSTTEQSNDPFATGGSGNGETADSGDTFGGYSGTGNGGGGSGKGRVRLNDPNISDIKSTIPATIYLKLTIDAQGNVIAAYNVKSKTTTTNQILINRVIHETKKQTKYNADPGSSLAKVYMTIEIKAQ